MKKILYFLLILSFVFNIVLCCLYTISKERLISALDLALTSNYLFFTDSRVPERAKKRHLDILNATFYYYWILLDEYQFRKIVPPAAWKRLDCYIDRKDPLDLFESFKTHTVMRSVQPFIIKGYSLDEYKKIAAEYSRWIDEEIKKDEVIRSH